MNLAIMRQARWVLCLATMGPAPALLAAVTDGVYYNADGAVDVRLQTEVLASAGWGVDRGHAVWRIEEPGSLRLRIADETIIGFDGELRGIGRTLRLREIDQRRREPRRRTPRALRDLQIDIAASGEWRWIDHLSGHVVLVMAVPEVTLDADMRAVTITGALRLTDDPATVGHAEIVMRLGGAEMLWYAANAVDQTITMPGKSRLTLGDTVCGNPGPDVIVGSLSGTRNFSPIDGKHAFSIGTTSCNIGDEELFWHSWENLHPVISQNMFRYHEDRFEQVGQSWLKHGFTALQQNTCGCGCTPAAQPIRLGVGCSDPYISTLNANQALLGPKYEVDPHTGGFMYPFTHGDEGEVGSSIYKRLQVRTADLDPLQDGGGLYFVEGMYVSPDDAAAGNGNNNASYRQIAVGGGMGSDYTLNFVGMPPTQREQPGIRAWQDLDPAVTETDVQIPDDGLVVVAGKAVELGGGLYRYEYAVQNLNAARGIGAVSVTFGAGTAPSAVGFHDVDYHSGEPWDGTDWPSTIAENSVRWATTPFHVNPNSNALRWGTLYNFRFESTAPPVSGFIVLEMFTPAGLDAPVRLVAQAVAPTGSFEPQCGNGITEPGEQCDVADPEVCTPLCTLVPDCGNGSIEPGEGCDPPDGIECDEACQTIATCGNGVIDEGEDCDPPDGVACDDECVRIPMCGDGLLDPGEECDPPDGVTCSASCLTLEPVTTRLFMAVDGTESEAPIEGSTTVVLPPGSSLPLAVWLQDEVGTVPLSFYQVILRWTAEPLAGAAGPVTYFDGSVLIDTARADYVFAGAGGGLPFYNETPPPPEEAAGFGFIGSLTDINAGVTVDGIRYLGEFSLVAAEDACGTYELAVVPAGGAPQGGTSLGGPGGGIPYPVDLVQTLQVEVPCVPCEAPCDDGDVCTVNDACDGPLCVGEPLDCGAFDDDCNVASCNPLDAQSNCDVLTPINEGLPCNGGVGTCVEGVCAAVEVTTRVFMAPLGAQGDVAFTGPTMMTLAAGSNATVGLWLQDNGQFQQLNFYQLILRWDAVPLGGTGLVSYVDDGATGGGSIVIDATRPDYVFSDAVDGPPFYNETPPPPSATAGFGCIGGLLDFNAGADVMGIRYLGEFELSASADATGQHELQVVPSGQPPQGGTTLGAPGGLDPYFVGEFQNLVVEIVEVEDCPAGTVQWLIPASGTVDARQPHPVGSLEPLQGIDTLTVEAPTGAAALCWTLCETASGGTPNGILDVTETGDGIYTLILDRPLTPGAVTTVTYDGAAVGQFIAHPGNVNGDSFSSALDILSIIDIINGVTVAPWGAYSEDVNHSGVLTPQDILGVIDLLNGADTFEVWNGTPLPVADGCP